MDKLVNIIEKITELGPDVLFEFHSIGLDGIYWKAKIEVNYTDLFSKKDFDKVKVIPALEERYLMEEVSSYPNRAVENITRRLIEVYEGMGMNDEQ